MTTENYFVMIFLYTAKMNYLSTGIFRFVKQTKKLKLVKVVRRDSY